MDAQVFPYPKVWASRENCLIAHRKTVEAAAAASGARRENYGFSKKGYYYECARA